MVDRVMRSQPNDLAREFQTSHNAHVKRDVRRGMKVIKRCHVMRIKARRMSQMISLYKVTKENLKNFRRDSNPRPFGCETVTLLTRPRKARLHGLGTRSVVS
ncbi:MAG: hypothetical protein PV344_02195 [Anaplasma sp.]|nr:hypothetical protein [Anaplasma sp.]